MDIYKIKQVKHNLAAHGVVCRIGKPLSISSKELLKFSLNLDYVFYYIFSKIKKEEKTYSTTFYKVIEEIESIDVVDKNVVEIKKEDALNKLSVLMTISFDYKPFIPLLLSKGLFHFREDKLNISKDKFWNKSLKEQLMVLDYLKRDTWACSTVLISMMGSMNIGCDGEFETNLQNTEWGYYFYKIQDHTLYVFGLDGTHKTKIKYTKVIESIIDDNILLVCIPSDCHVDALLTWKKTHDENSWYTFSRNHVSTIVASMIGNSLSLTEHPDFNQNTDFEYDSYHNDYSFNGELDQDIGNVGEHTGDDMSEKNDSDSEIEFQISNNISKGDIMEPSLSFSQMDEMKSEIDKKNEMINIQKKFNEMETNVVKSQNEALKQSIELAESQSKIIKISNDSINQLKMLIKPPNDEFKDNYGATPKDNEVFQDYDGLIENPNDLF